MLHDSDSKIKNNYLVLQNQSIRRGSYVTPKLQVTDFFKSKSMKVFDNQGHVRTVKVALDTQSNAFYVRPEFGTPRKWEKHMKT